jgi:hypothetical protein
MPTGWDGIVTGYEATIHHLTAYMLKYPDRSPDQCQYFVDHARAMLQVIPLLRMNPLLAIFQPLPYTSHDILTFSPTEYTNRLEVWCNVADQTYGVRLTRNGKTALETTAVIDNIVANVQQFIEYLLR